MRPHRPWQARWRRGRPRNRPRAGAGPWLWRYGSRGLRSRRDWRSGGCELACTGLAISSSHPEQAKARRLDRGVGRRRQPEAKHQPGIGGIDHAIIPKPGGGVVRTALAFILGADGLAKLVLILGRPCLALRLNVVAADLAQHHRGLLAAHYRDPCVRPRPQAARAVGTAAHAVIAGPIRAADHDCEFGHAGSCHGRHQFGTVARDAAGLIFLADHETRDVLQEHQRDIALTAKLDEMRALQRALAEQDAVVGDDADRIAPDVRKTANQRLAIKLLEFIELRAVDQARNDISHAVRLAPIRSAAGTEFLARTH